MKDKEKIKRCPYCNAKPHRSSKGEQHVYEVKHKWGCFFRQRGMDKRIFNFNITAWNQRACDEL